MEGVTLDQLKKIIPYANDKTRLQFAAPLNAAMLEFEINTPERIAAFLAQITHESGSLRYVEEIASGAAYEGREDLGNIYKGDGIKYKGRGLIQITGRNNYKDCGLALHLDLVNNPKLLQQPTPACRSAAWYWKSHFCNPLADECQFDKITKKINGGYNGKKDRDTNYARARKVLGV